MSYTINQLESEVDKAVKRERAKWQNAQVFWGDEFGNTFPVPVLNRVEWGGTIMIQIERPSQQHCEGQTK
jgi:hypothetical protein